MIANVETTAVGDYKLDDNTRKYVNKKIGSLDRLVPRHARKTMRAEVRIAEVNRDHGNKYEVEAILTVPDKVMKATDSTLNALAAVDIVEAKLAVQLRKYKAELIPHVGRRRLLDRFKRSYQREAN